jgi:thioredoxin-related protein
MKFLVVTLVAVMLSIALGSFAETNGIAWRSDLESATTEARQSGKVMMVDVYTDWCEWCKVLDTKTYTDAKVIEGTQQFVALKLNPEKSPAGAQFAKRYGVNGYPTVLFVEWNGTLVSRIEGYVDAASFAATVARTTQDGPKVKPYLAEFNAGQYRNSSKLVSMLVEMGRVDEAMPVFDRLRSTASLPAPFLEGTALVMAGHSLDEGQYDRSLGYIKIIEDIDSGSETYWNAHQLHAATIFYMKGKNQAIDYLDLLIANTATPEAWKDRYKDLESRIKAAKSQ